MRILPGCLLLLVATARAAAGDMAEEIGTDKVNYLLNAAFGRYGVGVNRGMAFEKGGLRMRVADTPKDNTQVGAYSHFSLAGDFEVSAAYEVLSLEKPSAGYGSSFGFAVHTHSPAGSVMVCRSCDPDGVHGLRVTRETPKEGGGFDYDSRLFPGPLKRGTLMIRREGDRLTVSAGEPGVPPTALTDFVYTADPVYQIRLYADSGGDRRVVDGRLSGLRVRAEHINGAATPPDQSWAWTTWLLSASIVLVVVGVALVVRKKRQEAQE